MRASLALACALLALTPPATAQVVSASADRARVAVGERVAFTVRVEGRDAAGAVVEPPDADGLFLVSRTPSLRGLTSVNGRATLTMRWLYEANRAGAGQIGAARVHAGSRTLTTDPIDITVTVAPAGTGPAPPAAGPRDDDLFVRAVARTPRPFVGQQVVVDYVLYFRPNLEPRSAQFVGAWQADGLWREELDVPASSRSPRPGSDGFWTVTVRRVALYPTRSGRVTLGELSFEIELLRRSANPFGLFGAFSSRVERATPVADPVELDVRPLPPGAPASFAGAVGRFSLQASLDRSEAEAGEPLRLTAVAEGNGNLATLPPPALEAPTSFEQYEPDEERTINRATAPAVGTKTWTWALVPRSGGRFEVAAEMAYFDPVAEEYRTLRIGPLEVGVSGAVDPVAVGADGPAPPMEPTEWVRAPSDRPAGFWLLAGAALPLVALVALAAGTRVRRVRRPAAPPPLAAARDALDDPGEFYRALGNSLRRGIDAGSATDMDAARNLLEVADRVLFAPGDPPSIDERRRHLAEAERLLARGDGRSARAGSRVLLLLVAAFLASPAAAKGPADAVRLMALGDSLLSAGDTDGAEAAYAAVERAGWTSAALAHNRGLAALRAGRVPESVAHLLYARRLAPGDPAIEQSLAAARTAAGTAVRPASWGWEVAAAVARPVGAAGLIALAAGLGLAAVAVRRRRPAALALAGAAVVAWCVAAAAWHATAQRAVAAVPTVVRAAPAAAAPPRGDLPAGRSVRLRAAHGAWVRVDGGWIAGRDLVAR